MTLRTILVACAVVLTACSSDGTTLSPPNPTEAPPPASALVVDTLPGSGTEPLASDMGSLVAEVAAPTSENPPASLVKVAVIGDSLSVAAEENVVTQLNSAGFDVIAYDAIEGRRIGVSSADVDSGVGAAQRVVDELSGLTPDVWVVALGTNDVGGQAEVAMIEEHAAELLAVTGTTPVVWIDTYVRSREDESWATNLALRRVASGHGDVAVASWYDVASTEGLLVTDGVHLTDAGELAFAQLITNALVADPRFGS